eukprot:scaffold4247_cov66-Cylindrotheca_fusiformis.AAC.25
MPPFHMAQQSIIPPIEIRPSLPQGTQVARRTPADLLPASAGGVFSAVEKVCSAVEKVCSAVEKLGKEDCVTLSTAIVARLVAAQRQIEVKVVEGL